MKYIEIEKNRRSLSQKLSVTLGIFHQTILACYLNDYSQREEIIVDDLIIGISADDILPYGIRSTKATYLNSVSRRMFMLFIDDPSCLSSEEAFDRYYEEFSCNFLPRDVVPSYVAFMFFINDYGDYERYMAVINAKFSQMRSFYTFKKLRKEGLLQQRLTSLLGRIGNQYNHFVLTRDVFYNEVIGFMRDSAYKDSLSIVYFRDNLDTLAAKYLNQKNLIVNDCVPDTDDKRYLALALAYISFRYKIPVLVDDLLQSDFLALLKRFYCSFDTFTAYDKVRYLKEFPKLCYLNQSILDFLVYVCPENRALLGRIEYLDKGRIKVEEVDLLATTCLPITHDSTYMDELVLLEDKGPEKKFLHVGNCLWMEHGGQKRFVRLIDIVPKYPAIVSPCDKDIDPFKKELGLMNLTEMLSCSAVTFHKADGNRSPLEKFVKLLMSLAEKNVIAPLNMQAGLKPYIPKYADDGFGPIVHEFTRIRGEQFRFEQVDKTLLDLFGFYSVVMRNELIDQITKIIPLYNLRHRSNYLTLYGANSTLYVEDSLFKTVSSDKYSV